MIQEYNQKMARSLVLDELFDLTLYRNFYKITSGDSQKVLGELIPVEVKHLEFWQSFFNIHEDKLDFRRRIKMLILVNAVRIFGHRIIPTILEAIEIYGIRKYLNIWKEYKGKPLGDAVREILNDEIQHEDVIVSKIATHHISPERIRSIFLGFNDGLVEMLGAVSGFLAAFHSISAVIIAWLTVAIAGSISMAASAYAGASSEAEVNEIEEGRRAFLGEAVNHKNGDSPFVLVLSVGLSYFFGSLIPITPIFLGIQNIFLIIVLAGFMIALVSLVLSFFSGMTVGRRIITNIVIVTIAVSVTYAVGTFASRIFGVSL